MKKKLLPLALAAAAGLTGVTVQAQTMTQNHNGTGQLLMYPIYTANGGNDTYVSIANTTDDYKAVKVRFVDAMNSQDSLDFHLYLSPQDHWSGVVTKDSATGGAVLKTGDTSCTVPNILASKKVGDLGTTAPMRTSKYATGGAEADAINNGIDRTIEGHVEVIEMGTIDAGTGSVVTGTTRAGDVLRTAIKHKSGVPGDCSALEKAWSANGAFIYADPDSAPGDASTADVALGDPSGGLYGYGVIINVPDGTAAMFDAVAIDGFMETGYHPTPGDDEPGIDDGVTDSAFINDIAATPGAIAAATGLSIFDGAAAATNAANYGGTGSNGLDHVDPVRGKTGSRLSGGGATGGVAARAGGGIAGSKEALSALLARTSLANDYVLEPALNAATDWVVTFPTKRDFVNFNTADGNGAAVNATAATSTAAASGEAVAPFSKQWNHAKTESCDEIAIDYWDREEGVNSVSATFDFSPAPVTAKTIVALCTESNIINFNGKGVLGGSSRITKDITLAAGFNNGWAKVTFGDGATAPEQTDGTLTVKGLPVIGFAIQKYVNGAAGANAALANYAGSIGHHYTTDRK